MKYHKNQKFQVKNLSYVSQEKFLCNVGVIGRQKKYYADDIVWVIGNIAPLASGELQKLALTVFRSHTHFSNLSFSKFQTPKTQARKH